jgi:hypothetical protein
LSLECDRCELCFLVGCSQVVEVEKTWFVISSL